LTVLLNLLDSGYLKKEGAPVSSAVVIVHKGTKTIRRNVILKIIVNELAKRPTHKLGKLRDLLSF